MSIKAMNWAWDQELSPPAAKLILLALADHADNTGTCFPGIEGIAIKCSMSERNATRLIHALTNQGLISASSQRRKGKQGKTIFQLNMNGRIYPVSAGQDVTLKTDQSTPVQPDILTPCQPDKMTPCKDALQPDKTRNYSLTKHVIRNSHTYSYEPKEEPTHNTTRARGKTSGNNGKNTALRFDDFWRVYPKKTGKKPTREKWQSRQLDSIADKLISDVTNRCLSDEQWQRGYIPNPLTYINQDRWEDEINTGNGTKPTSAAEARQQHQQKTQATTTGRTFDHEADAA